MSSTYDVIARGGLAWFLLGLAACEAPPRDTATEELTSSAELARLYDEIWVDTLANSALLRVREGAPVEHLDDLSNVSFRDSIGRSRDWLERLEAIDLDRLEHADWINARALRWDLETALESERWFWHEGVFTPYLSPLPSLRQIFQSLDVGNAAGRADYLDLLRHVRAFVEQLQERAHGQADRGIAVWRPNLEAAVALVRAQVGTAALGPFAVGASRLEAVERTDADSFLAGIDSILDQQIHPALELLASFLEGDYAASAPDAVGASQFPDGADWYRFATRRSTTLAVEPEEVHEIGLELVAGMEAEMAAIRAEIDFKGSREQFHRMLRTESRFFPDTPEEVRERLMAAATAMDEIVESYFLRRPSAPFSARRLDQDLEASQTYGFYQPPSADRPAGTYHYNGSRLDERSWLNLAAVALHELIPGHHFHIARQYENAALPELRRGSLHAAFTEGWGSYSSVLGLEAGIYDDDPYSRYGMYVLEIFLATRLVVDTGMNLLGWTLEEGRDYMREHTLESEIQIATESLRYSADMPAQALAYQMGKRKFVELREKAAAALGETFDLRRFHEAVLENGSLPMVVLEEHIDWWIEQQEPGKDEGP